MAEQLRPCPFCGSVNLLRMVGKHVPVHCKRCGADASDWNRRAPGPATQAMVEAVKRELQDFPSSDLIPVPREILAAFLAERAEPAPPPAPEQPTPSSPRTCCICGGRVRIGDDLRPWHLDGPANHDAELSSADRKTLADGLRLTD